MSYANTLLLSTVMKVYNRKFRRLLTILCSTLTMLTRAHVLNLDFYLNFHLLNVLYQLGLGNLPGKVEGMIQRRHIFIITLVITTSPVFLVSRKTPSILLLSG
jgi:hypothetical protein